VSEPPTPAAPAGYLGTDARISSGPAPELVEAGYALETADAPLLHRGLGLADLAHQVALIEAGAVDPADTAPLLRRLLELLDSDPADFDYDPVYGDAYNSRERVLQQELGAVAGWLHLGRTRREAGRIAFRIALRELLLTLHGDVCALAGTLAASEQEHADTLWADSTYLQPAQPSTFGHFLGHFGEQCLRHLGRLEAAYDGADVCPGGSGGAGGTRLRLDRTRLAELLGFAAAGANTRDAMWSTDGVLDAVYAAVQCGLTVDQLAEDLEIFASPAFDYVELDASLCRASVLMPQKRNPYALAVLRAGAGTLAGRLAGAVTTARTPSARTDNWLHTYGEVAGSLALAARLVRLGTAVVKGLSVRRERLAAAAGASFIGAADLAEDLSREFRVDYRTAYRIVGRAVANAVAAGRTELDGPDLSGAVEQITGKQLDLPDDLLSAVADARALVRARSAPGAAAPDRVREHADGIQRAVAAADDWRAARRSALADAESGLLSAVRAVLGAESVA